MIGTQPAYSVQALHTCRYHAATEAAAIQVTTPADEFADPGPGAGCSLREAIPSANTDTDLGRCTHAGAYGDDTITLPSGTYHLTIAGAGENDAATGDLDAMTPIAIQPVSNGPVTIDATGLGDRGFHVTSMGNLTLAGLTVTGGSVAGNGGGILRDSGGVGLRATVLDTGAPGANCEGTVASLDSNLSDDTSCSFGGAGDQNNTANLLLGPLVNNGGPSRTHALLDGSPAIDAIQGACTNDYPVTTVAAILGHTPAVLLKTYAQTIPQHVVRTPAASRISSPGRPPLRPSPPPQFRPASSQ